jgi:hypothetical protein
VLAQGTIGNRVEESLLAEPDHVDLDGDQPTLFAPATNSDEKVAKAIPLTPKEVTLFREQLGCFHVIDPTSPTSGCPTTPPGAPRIFMTPGYQA